MVSLSLTSTPTHLPVKFGEQLLRIEGGAVRERDLHVIDVIDGN